MPSVKERIRNYLLPQDESELLALRAEEEAAQEARSAAGIGSGIDKIISAIGRTQANPEAYTQMQKLAGEGPARIKEYLKNKYEREKDQKSEAAKIVGMEIQDEQNTESRKSNELQRDFNNSIASETLALRKSQDAREAAKGSPAQQEIDKKQAESAAEWVSGGRDRFNAGLDRLRRIQETLSTQEDSAIDRGRARVGHEGFLSNDQLKIKQDVLNATLPILKTLGSNPSEGERTALINSIYDPRLSPKTNITNITKKISEWEAEGASRDASAGKFTQTNTAPPEVPPGKKLQKRTVNGKTEYRVVPK